MTRVAILRQAPLAGDGPYRALGGDKQSVGRTAGEALDALVTQLPEDASGTIVVVRYPAADPFFTEAQQQRLAALMDRWRATRDGGAVLSRDEQAELDALVEAELIASAQRTAAVDQWLTDLADGPANGASLPADFSRADIYDDADDHRDR